MAEQLPEPQQRYPFIAKICQEIDYCWELVAFQVRNVGVICHQFEEEETERERGKEKKRTTARGRARRRARERAQGRERARARGRGSRRKRSASIILMVLGGVVTEIDAELIHIISEYVV